MDEQLKNVLDAIQTPERLKRTTKAALRRKTFDYGRNILRRRAYHRRLAAGLLSLALVLAGSGLWFLPATNISMDVNPSIEIRVNVLDRVICVEGVNADGVKLAKELGFTKLLKLQTGEQNYCKELYDFVFYADEELWNQSFRGTYYDSIPDVPKKEEILGIWALLTLTDTVPEQ